MPKMKKRYYSEDRESRERHEEPHVSSERRLDRQERNEENSGIRESKSEVANLPQRESYKPWPKGGDYVDYFLDDTIRGIDKQLDEDGAKMKKHLQPGKY